ncbi:retrovirus-related pol polyprotein from transposon TNT 1-94 [Tanacetum coccineum]
MSNPSTEYSDASPVKVEAPSELPNVSLVNDSLKRLKFHLAKFGSMVKKRTTPHALTEGEWGCSVDKQCFEIAKKELFLENDRLLQTIMSQDVLLSVMNYMSLNGEFVNVEMQRSESCEKCFNLDVEFSKTQNAYNDLLKSYSQLEKHCISLELSIQINQEIFQKDKSCDNQNALEILEYFENNDLKARLQDKDTTICKLKEIIKSMRENNKEENVNHDRSELETIYEDLENSVAKLISENERLCNKINHVKQVFKDQFDLIKKTRVRTKEQSNSLIDKLNLKSVENEDLKAQNQDKEQAEILQGIVEQAKAKQPLDNALDFACKHAKRIQELLVYVRDTCPNAIKLSEKKVVQIILWYLDSECSKHMTGDRSQLINFVRKFLGTVRFGNDQIAKIIRYGNYQLGKVIISRAYYIERLRHNLFSVGQFCDANLEVSFWKNTCFIRNLEGVDLLLGSRDTNLYKISLDDMLKTSLICLLSEASKTKSWLWHHRLSHLNFGTLNKLAKDGLARAISKRKFQKDHLCSACALGKSKKSSH